MKKLRRFDLLVLLVLTWCLFGAYLWNTAGPLDNVQYWMGIILMVGGLIFLFTQSHSILEHPDTLEDIRERQAREEEIRNLRERQ